jgi:hypothetical protein
MAVSLALGAEPPDINQPPPGGRVDPPEGYLRSWLGSIPRGIQDQALEGNLDGCVAVDIECAGPHLTMIGFCRLSDMSSITVTFRGRGGEPTWESVTELRARVQFCYDLLADPEIGLIFHNGQAFDVPYLVEYGFTVEAYVFDTLIAQWAAWPEMPKRLEFVAMLYEGIPRWKHIISDEVEEQEK